MEVTKWLKPSDSASRIGDGASVQAVTRVNAEQASCCIDRLSRHPEAVKPEPTHLWLSPAPGVYFERLRQQVQD